MGSKKDLINEWLLKSDHDLGMARLALEYKPEYTDQICFHCQQVAEKCLKAFLSHLDIAFPKTHHLSFLLDLIVEKRPVFNCLYDDVEKLEDYSVEVRYPSDWENPSLEDAADALKIAEKIRGFIINQIED